MNNRKIIPYNPKLKEIARKLRKQGILSEVLLWNELKKKKILGYDFHRQKPLDNYIVDFFCYELLLVIEIDGITHDYKQDNDKLRQEKLESYGLTFLRYQDIEVKKDLEAVLDHLTKWINRHTPSR
jgi:very-short-patch-repair endonuclease